jgi:leucyl/phenylalanyl-tRNA--protein transferase
MPVFLLPENSIEFPQSELAEDDGLLAIGGNLSVRLLLKAYSNGVFPWYEPEMVIHWWCPKERFVIFPDRIHISKSMWKMIRTTSLRVRFNKDFSSIINTCKMMRQGGTWITDDMEAAYNRMFDAGYAMCVGVYDDETLVGGLYGVVIGKCFFGESMFSKAANASKLALICLCERLSAEGFGFVDCQFRTEHLESMGGRFISWKEYRGLLKKCL